VTANPEFTSFARLVESLSPWLDQVVVIGGWAHRLHRFHPAAQVLDYAPLTTLDADVALPTRFRVAGQELYDRLTARGFEAEFLGHHKPPAAHYRLADPGIEFYAEFLTPLVGGTHKRGKPNATKRVGGVASQNLRHIEVLLRAPWTVSLSAANGFPLAEEAAVLVANPTSFLAQKILIHAKRNRTERAKDILYMHDTLETFGPRIAELRNEWTANIRPNLHAKNTRGLEKAGDALFGEVTDPIRAASRIAQGRILRPEIIREVCNFGFKQIFEAGM